MFVRSVVDYSNSFGKAKLNNTAAITPLNFAARAVTTPAHQCVSDIHKRTGRAFILGGTKTFIDLLIMRIRRNRMQWESVALDVTGKSIMATGS